MVSEERLKTVQYSSEHLESLKVFCEKCRLEGNLNNSSLKAMRLEWALETGGQFFLTYLDDELISVSGCHPLPAAGPGVFRVLFRGIELELYRNVFDVVSKSHMSSIPFYYHLPLQREWAKQQGAEKLVITTNKQNPDGIVSMDQSHRVFQLLEKQGMVTCLTESIMLFDTEQSIWSINLDYYDTAREGFRERNGLR
jgi:hypothetical protein